METGNPQPATPQREQTTSEVQPLEAGTPHPASRPRDIWKGLLIVFAGLWLALCLSATSIGVGYLIGRGTGTSADDVFGPFFQAWDIIHSRYVDQPVDDVKLIQGAINGMMESLGDENSTYMDPETFENASDTL